MRRSCVPWSVLVAVAAALLTPVPARAHNHRFMIGESIRVGPDDTLEQATCIFCSIYVEGMVQETAFLVLGRLVNQGTIAGDAVVIGGQLESSGSVRGNTVVVAGNMDLSGEVGGDAIAIVGNSVARGESVRIGGDALTVMGRKEGFTPDKVAGNIEHFGGESIGRLVLSGLIGALVLFAIGTFCVLMAMNVLGYFILGTKRLEVIASTVSGNSPACFVLGLGTCFALTIIGLIVAMLLPVSVPMLLMFFILSAVGYCGMAYGTGRNLFGRFKPVTSAVVGAALIVFVQLLPVVGWLVMVVLWNVAIGAAVMSGFGTSTDWLTARTEGRALRRPAS